MTVKMHSHMIPTPPPQPVKQSPPPVRAVLNVRTVQQYRRCLKVRYTIRTDLRQLTLLAMAFGALSTLVCGHAFASRITQLFNPLSGFGVIWWFACTMAAAMGTLAMGRFTCTALGIYLDMRDDEDAIARWGEVFSYEDALGRVDMFKNRLWALVPFGLDICFR